MAPWVVQACQGELWVSDAVNDYAEDKKLVATIYSEKIKAK
jgi:hypothetical protein